MFKGCALKFSQNEKLAEQLKALPGRIIEANPKDTFFSCGLALTDPLLEDQSKWKGDNILGEILMEVRHNLQA